MGLAAERAMSIIHSWTKIGSNMSGIVGQDPNGRSGLLGKISSLHFGGSAGYVAANNLRLQGTTMVLAAGESGFSVTDDANARTEFKIDSVGRVHIGGAGMDATFGIKGTGTGYGIFFEDATPTNRFWVTDAGQIWSSVSGNVTSDKRAKENISYIESASDIINDLKPATFDLNEDHGSLKNRAGFIAQDVESVLPHAVQEEIPETNNLKSLDYNHLMPYMVKAIQELSKKVAALEAN
jgi:hypothetical protein